jgi:nitroreductase
MPAPHPKHAAPDHPLLAPIAARWSPYAYDPSRDVPPEQLLSCLEAARWAASSYNEQPWTFLIARRSDQQAFETLLGCLLEANQQWAKQASVLMLTVVQHDFRRNGKPNRVAAHDIGLAAGNLVLQATALGIDAHQMAGIDLDKARETYGIPDGYAPLTAIALGYALSPDAIDDAELQSRETAPRSRKSLSELVFAGRWGTPAEL